MEERKLIITENNKPRSKRINEVENLHYMYHIVLKINIAQAKSFSKLF